MAAWEGGAALRHAAGQMQGQGRLTVGSHVAGGSRASFVFMALAEGHALLHRGR